jgi:hypothetical protein
MLRLLVWVVSRAADGDGGVGPEVVGHGLEPEELAGGVERPDGGLLGRVDQEQHLADGEVLGDGVDDRVDVAGREGGDAGEVVVVGARRRRCRRGPAGRRTRRCWPGP